MHDLSVFRYWDQMSCALVGSLCPNVISWGIVMLTQAFGWVGGKPQGTESQDCFSSCSSCWTNGRGGGVAGAIPDSQDALTWSFQLVVGEQPGIFFIQSKEPAAKSLPVAPSMAQPHGGTMGALKGAKRGEDLLHSSREKGTWAKGHGVSWLTRRCWVYLLITGALKGHIPMQRRAQPRACGPFTTAREYQRWGFLLS